VAPDDAFLAWLPLGCQGEEHKIKVGPTKALQNIEVSRQHVQGLQEKVVKAHLPAKNFGWSFKP